MSKKTDDTGRPAKLPDMEQVKTIFLVLPIAGSLAAITFDVGYFNGIGLEYFTLFSLSEHIVFALAVAPIAFLAALVMGVFVLILPPSEDNRARLSKGRMQFIITLTIIAFAPGIVVWWFTGRTVFLFSFFPFATGFLMGSGTLGLFIDRPLLALLIVAFFLYD
jgi:hypothetical protein